MSHQKLPNSKSVEELLQDLETTEEAKNPFLDDVVEFLSFFNIRPGTEQVSRLMLLRLYTAWSKEPVKAAVFYTRLRLYLETTNKMVYIDRGTFKLSNDAFEYLKKSSWEMHKSPSFQRHFQNYLSYHSLESGSEWVELEVLYYLYDKWAFKNKRTTTISKTRFKLFLDSQFKNKKVTGDNTIWYGVSDLSKFITQKEIDEIREGIKFREKKAKPKKSNKVLSTRTKSKPKD